MPFASLQCNETPLFSAVAAENVAIVQALVNAGADVNAKDTVSNIAC